MQDVAASLRDRDGLCDASTTVGTKQMRRAVEIVSVPRSAIAKAEVAACPEESLLHADEQTSIVLTRKSAQGPEPDALSRRAARRSLKITRDNRSLSSSAPSSDLGVRIDASSISGGEPATYLVRISHLLEFGAGYYPTYVHCKRTARVKRASDWGVEGAWNFAADFSG